MGKESRKIKDIPTSDDFDLYAKMTTIKNADAPVNRLNPITGNVLPYAKTYKYTGRELTETTRFAAMDIYENFEESAGFLFGSDQMAFFYDKKKVEMTTEKTLDDPELIVAAKAFLDGVYPEGWSDGLIEQIKESGTDGKYWVSFTRSAYGYSLYDVVSVVINGNGVVASFNGRRFGSLEEFEDEYSMAEIVAAQNSILEKMKTFDIEILNVSKPRIEKNPSGEVFLTITFESLDSDANGSVLTAIDSISTPLRISNP